jgi:hypothetical protein
MLEKVPGDVASWCCPYLVAKSSHVGVDVDRLAYPPTPSYGLQLSDGGTGVPARCCLVPSGNSRQWRFTRGCEAPGLTYL